MRGFSPCCPAGLGLTWGRSGPCESVQVAFLNDDFDFIYNSCICIYDMNIYIYVYMYISHIYIYIYHLYVIYI